MIDLSSFQKLTIAVLGLGRSGLASAVALRDGGANVLAWDDSEGVRKIARQQGLVVSDLHQQDWKQVSALVMSPGIPLYFPQPNEIADKARMAGCEIIGDIEVLARAQTDSRYIGITGTNGKSTTTALIAHILTQAGCKNDVGGNLGMAALSLQPMATDGTYILEMSSYQLDLTHSLAWDIAILLNITPDHLGRHGGMDGYIKAKCRMFEAQNENQTAIIGIDDEHCRKIFEQLTAQNVQNVIPVSSLQAVDGGVYVRDGMLIDNIGGHEDVVCCLTDIETLPGLHNAQNATAAYAAAYLSGVSRQNIITGLRTFAGLAHRQETVAVIDGISFINDSKATNAEATVKALGSYQNIYWIAGGQAKEGGITALMGALGEVRHAYLIGEAATTFAVELEGHVARTVSGNLETAVKQAHTLAQGERRPNAKVLLSPACASFDQFNSFEARGDAFRDIVKSLPGAHAADVTRKHNSDQQIQGGEAV